MMSRFPILPPDSPTTSESSDEDIKDVNFLSLVVAAAEEQQVRPLLTRRYVERDRIDAKEHLIRHYFNENPVYNEEVFKERFWMSKNLFLKIVADVTAHNNYFEEGMDARGWESFSAIHKCTSAIRQLVYGNVPDEYDEYLAMVKRTSRETLDHFVTFVFHLYKDEFLRAPTSHDIARLYQAHEAYHGLPGMLGSIDCTHRDWRNCPKKYRGQFHRGDHKYLIIILEAIASQDRWCWHGYFGVAGSNNYINVLNQSPLFSNEMHGIAPRCSFHVKGSEYKRGYYLADGIYPS